MLIYIYYLHLFLPENGIIITFLCREEFRLECTPAAQWFTKQPLGSCHSNIGKKDFNKSKLFFWMADLFGYTALRTINWSKLLCSDAPTPSYILYFLISFRISKDQQKPDKSDTSKAAGQSDCNASPGSQERRHPAVTNNWHGNTISLSAAPAFRYCCERERRAGGPVRARRIKHYIRRHPHFSLDMKNTFSRQGWQQSRLGGDFRVPFNWSPVHLSSLCTKENKGLGILISQPNRQEMKYFYLTFYLSGNLSPYISCSGV